LHFANENDNNVGPGLHKPNTKLIHGNAKKENDYAAWRHTPKLKTLSAINRNNTIKFMSFASSANIG